MAREIDERVVEMRFDNKQFESGAKESISTLDKLKQSLNLEKASKAFDLLGKHANAVNLSGISRSVAALEKRFSTMGIVGMQVISNITDSLQNKVASAVGFVNESIVQGGKRRAMNIENAHFQLQALLKDEKKVQAVMDDAMQSVDGTAYAYDEAAKAASQFSATGLQAGKDMQKALSGITGVAAMTNSSYESISMIFTTVAGNGRLMGDQLLQLSSRGLNAASTIKDYFNAVLDGSKTANEELTAAIKNVSKGTKVTEGDIRDLVSKGQISFSMFSAAMTDAFGDSAKRANETFTGAFSNMKAALARIGAEFYSPLVAQNSEVVKLFNVLKDKINDFKKEITFADGEREMKSFSSRFTKMVLALAKSTSKFVKDIDVSKPFEIIYTNADGLVNIFKAMENVLKPLGKAFGNVFGDIFSLKKIQDMADGFKMTTALIRAMSNQTKFANNLTDTFEGLFSVLKTVFWIFGKLIGAFIPGRKELFNFNGGILDFTASLGRALTKMSGWIQSSKQINLLFKGLNKGVELLVGIFIKLGEGVESIVDEFGGWENIIKTVGNGIEGFIDKIENLAKDIYNFGDGAEETFKKLGQGIKDFAKGGSDSFEGFKSTLIEVKDWIGNFFSKFFADLSFGNVASIGIGSGLIAAIFKIANAIESVTKKIDILPTANSVLKELGNTLKTYQNTLKAEQLKNIAIAIGILTASIFVLSKIPTDKLLVTMGSLTLVVVAIGEILTKLTKTINEGEKVNFAMQKFYNSISRTVLDIGKSVKRVATGKMVKDFATSILMIAGSIIALGKVYQENPKAIEDGGKIVGIIAGVLLGITTAMSIVAIPLQRGMLAFAQVSKGILAISASLYIILAALDKLFKIELPEPASLFVKIGLLVGIFTALGLLEMVTAVAARLAGGQKFKAGPIIEIAAGLYIMVMAIEKLFAIKMPKDAAGKLVLLAGLFVGFMFLIKTVSKASALAGGSLKAGGTIVAMAIFIGVAVGAIAILGHMKFGTILKGAIAFGAVLLILSTALDTVGNAHVSNDGYKSIIAMAVAAVAIAVSLGILSAIPFKKLLPAAVALGGVLMALGKAMEGAGGLKKDTWKSMIPMIASVVVIAISLGALANQPWDALLAAGVSLGGVLMALAGAFKIIASSDVDWTAVGQFMVGTMGVLVIASSLTILASQPWESIAAAGGAMSATMLALSASMLIMSHAKINVGSIGAFLGAIVMLGAVTAALYILAQQDYNAIQIAGEALTKVMLAMSVAMAATIAAGILAPAAISGIAVMVAMVAVYTGLVAALGALFSSKDAKGLINGGIDILNQIALGIGEFAGNIVSGFLNTVADGLPNIAVKLSAFAVGLTPFVQTMGRIKPEVAEGVSSICKALLMITGAELLNGIMEFFGGEVDWEGFKTKMESFGEAIKSFANKVEGVSEKDVKGAAAAAKVMLALQENLPKEGGWMQKVFGEQMDLETFGDQLVSFGKAITKFAAKVKGLSPDCADAARTAGQTMAELANSLPEESSWKSTIFGGKTIDLDEFGDQIFTFGDCMVKFSNKVAGISTDAVKKAKDCGDIMNTLASGLGEKDGLWQKLAGGGSMTLADFGEDLNEFGEDMKNFSDTVSGVSTTTISAFTKEVSKLVDLGTKSSSSVGNLTKLSKAIKELSKSGLKDLGMAFTKSSAGITASINYTLGGAVKTINGYKSKFSKAAANSVSGFGGVMMLNITRQSSGIKKSLVALGLQVGNGMAQGIKESTPKVKAAAKQLANAVDREVKNALDIHSPSRLMRTRGDQIGTGLAQGIGDSEPKVSKKVNGITKAIISTLATTNFVKSGKHLSNNLIDMLDSVFNKAHKTMKRHEMKFDIVAKANALYAKVTKSTKKFYDDQADLQRKYDREKEKYEKQKEKKQEAEQKLKEAKQRAKEAKEARNEAYGIKKKEQTKAQKKAQADRDLAKANKELAKAEAEAAKYGVSTADKKAAAAEKNRKTAEKNAKTAKQDKNTAAEQKKIGEQEKKFGEIKEKTANKNEKSAKKESENSKKNENTSKKNAENAKKDSKSSKTKEKNANRDSKSADKNAKTAEKNAKTAEKNAKTAEKNKKISEVEAKPKAIGNKMDPITEEEQFWINLLRVKQNGADAAEYLDMSYKEFQAKTLQDVASIIKEYTDQLEQERDSILGSMNLFADVEEEDPMSMADLQTYMEKNVQKIAEFQTAFSKLMARVKGTALEGLVSEMDLSDYSVVMALAGATDEELQRYAETYQRGVDSATEIAKLNMQDVQKNAENQLQDIFNTKKPINLFDFTKAWDGTAEGMKTFLDNLDKDETPKKIGRKLNKITSGAISDKLKEMSLDFANQGKQAGKDVGNAVKEGITDVMEEDPNVMKDQVDTYIDGAKDEKGAANRAGTSVANAAVKGLESRESQFYIAGVNAGSGFVAGLQSQLEAARAIAAELASVAAGSINKELDIHSPSRVLMWSGNQAGIGFVLGLEQYIAVAGQVAKRMGDRTSSKLEDGFKGLSRIINSEDIHVDPTITPQVDLTNVRNAADEMNDLFNRAIRMKQMDIQAMDVSIRSQKAASTPNGQAASGTVIEQKFEFNQTNTSPKALSAIDIYRQTNNQFSQLKGVLSNDTRRYSH